MNHDQIIMWAAFNAIMARQAAREIVQEATALMDSIEAEHDAWKREDNAWRIPLLHRAELARHIPCPH